MMALPDHYEILESGYLLISALRLAIAYRCSFFDAVYVELALKEGCPLVTADEKLSGH